MRRSQVARRQRRRSLGVAAFLGVLMLGAAACTAGSDSSAMHADAGLAVTDAAGTPDTVGTDTAGKPQGTKKDTSKSSQKALPVGNVDGRDVIRTAAVQVRLTLDPSITGQTPPADVDRAVRSVTTAAAAQARSAATGAGGYVSDSEQREGVYTVTARIPRAGYDAFLLRMGELGDVIGSNETSQDVTSQIADTASRITTMRASVARVRALLDEAKDVTTIVRIESQLTSREADLESLLAQQAALADQVTYSTVVVSFSARSAPVDEAVVAPAVDERSGFVKGLAAGWHALVAFLTWVAAVFGAVLPFLPVVIVVAVAAGLVRRWVRNRKAPIGGDHPSPPSGPAPAAA